MIPLSVMSWKSIFHSCTLITQAVFIAGVKDKVDWKLTFHVRLVWTQMQRLTIIPFKHRTGSASNNNRQMPYLWVEAGIRDSFKWLEDPRGKLGVGVGTSSFSFAPTQNCKYKYRATSKYRCRFGIYKDSLWFLCSLTGFHYVEVQDQILAFSCSICQISKPLSTKSSAFSFLLAWKSRQH